MTETATRVAQPGDVVELAAPYDSYPAGTRGVIDSSELYLDEGRRMVVLNLYGGHAFRDESGHVSASGGPCPFVPLTDLVEAGTATVTFWKWIDRPRANGGVDYELEVTRWLWTPPAR